MTKTINLSRLGSLSMGATLALLLVSSFGVGHAEAAITSSLALGSRGNQVTELQQFLATNNGIYPEGIISGYFGGLTREAVIQFQIFTDLPQVGRVGPMTQAKINEIMNSGLGLDIDAPILRNVSIQTANKSAVVNWTTNELARGQVYYDRAPIQASETTMRAEQGYVSGTLATTNADLRMSQAVNISGLQPNTTYYYLVRAVDASGNVNVTWPSSFRTSQ